MHTPPPDGIHLTLSRLSTNNCQTLRQRDGRPVRSTQADDRIIVRKCRFYPELLIRRRISNGHQVSFCFCTEAPTFLVTLGIRCICFIILHTSRSSRSLTPATSLNFPPNPSIASSARCPRRPTSVPPPTSAPCSCRCLPPHHRRPA